jgi:hypothetical protein
VICPQCKQAGREQTVFHNPATAEMLHGACAGNADKTWCDCQHAEGTALRGEFDGNR